jgi:hypothetical protein
MCKLDVVEKMSLLSPVEKMLYRLKVEESRLRLHNSITVFDKSIILYFFFLFVGVIGFINSFISINLLYALVICGIFVLLIGLIPYVKNATAQSDLIENLIHDLEKRRK